MQHSESSSAHKQYEWERKEFRDRECARTGNVMNAQVAQALFNHFHHTFIDELRTTWCPDRSRCELKGTEQLIRHMAQQNINRFPCVRLYEDGDDSDPKLLEHISTGLVRTVRFDEVWDWLRTCSLMSGPYTSAPLHRRDYTQLYPDIIVCLEAGRVRRGCRDVRYVGLYVWISTVSPVRPELPNSRMNFYMMMLLFIFTCYIICTTTMLAFAPRLH
jgi:hypothetical protein